VQTYPYTPHICSHTQANAYTYKLREIHTYTERCIQTQRVTYIHILIETDTERKIQTDKDTDGHRQTETDKTEKTDICLHA
jgi:hypothetical protein